MYAFLIVCQSWYLLGPLTRFQVVGEKVVYEVAQVPLTACRMSESTRDVKVFDENTVRGIQTIHFCC